TSPARVLRPACSKSSQIRGTAMLGSVGSPCVTAVSQHVSTSSDRPGVLDDRREVDSAAHAFGDQLGAGQFADGEPGRAYGDGRAGPVPGVQTPTGPQPVEVQRRDAGAQRCP